MTATTRNESAVAAVRSWSVAAAAMLALALIGIGISIYLTIVHYAKLPLACPAGGGVINCQAVTSSPYSVIGGTNVPITVPGIGWFVVSGLLAGVALAASMRRLPVPDWLPPAHAIWGALGLVFVIYLIYVEAARLGEFCEWCSGVHLLVILTFIIAIARWQRIAAARYR